MGQLAEYDYQDRSLIDPAGAAPAIDPWSRATGTVPATHADPRAREVLTCLLERKPPALSVATWQALCLLYAGGKRGLLSHVQGHGWRIAPFGATVSAGTVYKLFRAGWIEELADGRFRLSSASSRHLEARMAAGRCS